MTPTKITLQKFFRIRAVRSLFLISLFLGSLVFCQASDNSYTEFNFTATPTNGSAPLAVEFSASSSAPLTAWAWDFNNDGIVDSTEPNPSYTYAEAGVYSVKLVVSGPEGQMTKTRSNFITVTAPDWALKSPKTLPSARYFHGLVYDSIRQVTLAFGGISGYTRLNDTWEWNGSDWTRQNPINSPSGRERLAMAFDSRRGVAVLFGGADYEYPKLDDTWEWNGNDWSKKDPIHKPTPRSNHVMAYDEAREVVVLFGGGSDPSETWEWNGTDWCLKNPVDFPSARTNYQMTYDSKREVAVLFGGYDGGAYRDDTWEWNGSNWTLRQPVQSPTPRTAHAMTYNSTTGQVILFGGQMSGDFHLLNDTWAWDGNEWIELHPKTVPFPARQGHALAYDSIRKVVVMYGGDRGACLDDIWELQ